MKLLWITVSTLLVTLVLSGTCPQIGFAVEDEVAAAETHLRSQRENLAAQEDTRQAALASLCHVLLNSNEFIYVD